MTTPTSKGLQCKDIPDELFLKIVENAAWARDRPYATLWDTQLYLTKAMWSLWWAKFSGPLTPIELFRKDLLVTQDLIPVKLVRNKARKLIRRGLMSGCYCGCRGEWRIVPEIRTNDGEMVRRLTFVVENGPKNGWGTGRESRRRDENPV